MVSLRDDFEGGLGEVGHFDEPLVAEIGFDGGFTAVAVADLGFVGFVLVDRPWAWISADDFLGRRRVHPFVGAGVWLIVRRR